MVRTTTNNLCTQLFLSYPSNIDSSITCLQNALQAVPSWMTAILLILTLQKLNFSSLDSNNNWLKLTPHLTRRVARILHWGGGTEAEVVRVHFFLKKSCRPFALPAAGSIYLRYTRPTEHNTSDF